MALEYFSELASGKYFIKSDCIKVYPCAYRGQYTDESGNTKSYNIEAKLNTEYNLTHTSGILGRNSYILDDSFDSDTLVPATSFKFILNGYYFEITEDVNADLKEILTTTNDTLTAYIKLDTVDSTAVPGSVVLTDLYGSSAAGSTLDNEDAGCFTGICFSKETLTSATNSLSLFKNSSGTILIDGASTLPNIKTVDLNTVNIADGVTVSTKTITIADGISISGNTITPSADSTGAVGTENAKFDSGYINTVTSTKILPKTIPSKDYSSYVGTSSLPYMQVNAQQINTTAATTASIGTTACRTIYATQTFTSALKANTATVTDVDITSLSATTATITNINTQTIHVITDTLSSEIGESTSPYKYGYITKLTSSEVFPQGTDSSYIGAYVDEEEKVNIAPFSKGYINEVHASGIYADQIYPTSTNLTAIGLATNPYTNIYSNTTNAITIAAATSTAAIGSTAMPFARAYISEGHVYNLLPAQNSSTGAYYTTCDIGGETTRFNTVYANGLNIANGIYATTATKLDSERAMIYMGDVEGSTSTDFSEGCGVDLSVCAIRGVQFSKLNSTAITFTAKSYVDSTGMIVGATVTASAKVTNDAVTKARVIYYTDAAGTEQAVSPFIFITIPAGSDTASGSVNLSKKAYSVGAATVISSYDGNPSALLISNDFAPKTSSTYNLGESTLLWNNIYAKTSEIITSDRNAKKEIQLIDAKYSTFFDKLQPVSYKFIENTSDRTHIGLISQDVEEALTDADLTSKDFAGFIKSTDKEGNDHYGLRYDEFIGLLIKEVQSLKARVAELEEKNK